MSRSVVAPRRIPGLLLAAFAFVPGLAPAQVAGPNVNLVSGTGWPGGDPFLQRQNEPSSAVSTRNPMHLMAGANDYRTVDLPGLPDDRETGDAWLGVFTSSDGGTTWRSTLLPGYPQEAGSSSPLFGFEAGADPTVRAGTHGLFYYSGIVFDRDNPVLLAKIGRAPKPALAGAGSATSAVFVARYIDNNNKENAESIAYLGTSVVSSNATDPDLFLDKPWLAVDMPRKSAPTCPITQTLAGKTVTQSIPAGTVYLAFSRFRRLTSGDFAGELAVSRSADCGATWSTPVVISAGHQINQGATIAIDPRTGTVYVVWRRFGWPRPPATPTQPDAILVARSVDRGRTFNPPEVVATLVGSLLPFDQGTDDGRFRTNAYPSAAVDREGRLYVVFSARGLAPGGDAKVGLTHVVYPSRARVKFADEDDTAEAPSGKDPKPTWPAPVAITPDLATRGHQIMPMALVADGRLQVAYVDLREDHTWGTYLPDAWGVLQETRVLSDERRDDPSRVFTATIDDRGLVKRRHTADVFVAQSPVGSRPAFTIRRVSSYRAGVRPEEPQTIQQLQFNPPNLPLFKLGTRPFWGDYIDAAALAFDQKNRNKWRHALKSDATFVVFTDNRDVRPPLDGDWASYTPPASAALQQTSLFDPTRNTEPCESTHPERAGMRNQNVYGARVSQGLVVGVPGNAKPLALLERAFVVFVENTTFVPRTFRLTILDQPTGGSASFRQFGLLTTIDVAIAPRSSISRTVYVSSSDRKAAVDVSVQETSGGVVLPPTSGGLEGRATINPDTTNPDMTNPDMTNPDMTNADVLNVEVHTPDMTNPDMTNPDMTNPDMTNPDMTNPDMTNPDMTNPDVVSLDPVNADVPTPDMTNPDMTNPDMTNPDMTNASVSDTIWTITNLGNTTSAYDVRLLLRGTEVPDGFTTQLMIYRTYQTPVSRDCQLSVQTQNLLVATIPNPPILPAGSPVGFDPADGSLQHATLWLAPGESARVALRVLDPDKTDDLRFDPLASVTAAAIAHAVDSDAAASGVTEPTPVTPKGALLSFEQPPTQSPIGGLVTPPVRVWLRDESGASVPGVTVTLSLVSGPAGAAVHGGTAVTGADGRATFPSLWLDRVGHYQLRASAAGRDVDAASFDVVPLVVDGTADAGPGSLREAILNANRNVGYADSISFAIPESGPHTIIPTSGALPYVTDPVTIDATTQPGYLSTPVVELSGGGGAPWGLAITGGSSTVRGLAISGFTPGWGIGLFRPGEGNVIQGNFVGTDATGTVARGNNEGIIVDSANNLVGGAAPGERNVIAGNLADGVNVQSGASANRIVGNYIGTDVSGSIVLGTGQFGISITNATGNVVGGPEPGAGNVVAGSTHAGVRVAGSAATGTQILGNRIGTNAAGTAALGNSWAGVLLDSSAAETLVGGMGPGQRNLISGNTGVGIHVSGSNRNRVEGNYVGTNAAGDAPLPNTGMGGVWITGEDNEVRGNLVSGNANTGVTINGGLRTVLDGNSIGTNAGGTAALPNAAGGVNYSGSGPASHAIRNNVVSGNAYYGIWLTGADHVSVTGNRIGTNAAGNAALPNGAPGGGFTYGLRLAGCIDSVVGGPSAGDGNVVSGNVGDGILLDTYAEFGIVNCVVQGNHVGMDAAGANAIPNTGVGVQVLPSLAPVAQIGSFAIDGNLISGNGLAGVSLSNGVHHLALTRNTIGTDLGGSLARPNGGTGVDAFGDVHDVVIGGAAASANLISGNAGHGVQLVAPGPPAALHNEVSFNLIGTNRAGATAIGNGMSGIAVSGGQAHDNRVAGNLISGNGASGVSIAGGAHDNVVVGNTIGTDAAAALALPNHENGVILSAAPDNVIGAVDEGNVIAGNSRFGVALYPGSDRNVIVGNWIGTNSSATADLGNGGYGVFMSGSSMNRLGGLGQGNTIAHNALAGIGLANASNTTGNRFWMNSVFENGGLGVDLGNDGVTANDPLDGDSGPNDLLNHPVLTAATAHDGVTTVTATVDIPLGFAEIQFFVNESCDASGHGEGGTYVGSEGLNSPGGGPTLVNVDLPGEFAGRFLTAATSMISPVRETSEFSACRLVVPSTTVVDTFDAAGTFHPQNNTVAADGYAPPLMPMSPATRAAVRFTLPPASSQYQLASISLPISFQGTDAATLRVRLAQDSAGLPGPTLEVLSHNESRWPAFTNPFATTTTLSSPTGPVLVGGASYWIVVELTAFPSGSADYRWFQNQSGTGLLPVLQQQIDSSTPGWLPQDLPGDPWTGPTVTSSVQPLALRVEAVPLP